MMKSNSRQKQKLTQCLDSIPASANSCVLAFSGGLDSCVLLHLLVSHLPQFKKKLWHVNHGLQTEADAMADFCQQQADIYNLELEISHLNLQAVESNIEATARTARYQLFAQGLKNNDYLLTAHHADDQVETFFLNLLRGSGSAGLSGIAAQKTIGDATLIRPMLQFKRSELFDYAKQFDLKWFEDPSNRSDQFNRNYLRHRVMPRIQKRWQNYQKSITTVCEIQSESQQMLHDLGEIDYALVVSPKPINIHASSLHSLDITRLKSLSVARQKNVMRYWLRVNNRANLPKARLDTFIKALSAKQDSNPIIENSKFDIRIYDNRVFIVDPVDINLQRSVYDFSTLAQLEVPEIGLLIQRQSVFDRLKLEDNGQIVQLRFRLKDAFEDCQRHRLKRLFQKHKIPPWLRSTTPQLLIDGELMGLWDSDFSIDKPNSK